MDNAPAALTGLAARVAEILVGPCQWRRKQQYSCAHRTFHVSPGYTETTAVLSKPVSEKLRGVALGSLDNQVRFASIKC